MYDLLSLSSNENIDDYKNYIIFNREQYNENKEGVKTFLVENKFIDFKWEILLEDSSSYTADISLLKIVIKIVYFNMSDMRKRELKMVLDEKSFEEFLDECKKIYKNF